MATSRSSARILSSNAERYKLRMVLRDSPDAEMSEALKEFDLCKGDNKPICSEEEDAEVRKYWEPLHALYSEVNRRLEKMSDDMKELGHSYESAFARCVKRRFERDILHMYRQTVAMHKKYVEYLPLLHKEVEQTLHRVKEFNKKREDEYGRDDEGDDNSGSEVLPNGAAFQLEDELDFEWPAERVKSVQKSDR